MPLPDTMARIARLARLSELETRCLRLHCGGRPADEIAEILGIEAGVVIGAVLSGQGRCRAAYPWMREPTPAERLADRRRTDLENIGRRHRGEKARPYVEQPRRLEDDLARDAAIILRAVANRSSRPGRQRSGPGPRAGEVSGQARAMADIWVARLIGPEPRAVSDPRRVRGVAARFVARLRRMGVHRGRQ